MACSSDVETVIQTLIDIGNNHAEVISGNLRLPDPYALLVDFGDSSLDLELRVMIRDANPRRHVTSDLNRAINAAFNKKVSRFPSSGACEFSRAIASLTGSGASLEATGGGEAPH